jgi:hypothetical protein
MVLKEGGYVPMWVVHAYNQLLPECFDFSTLNKSSLSTFFLITLNKMSFAKENH